MDNIMKYETILPADFDGVFRFTNWTEENFVGVWGGKQYLFPKQATSPIIIPEHSPLEIQNIRKKFAKDLAEREFYKSKEYKNYHRVERNTDGSPRLNSIQQATAYSMNDLTPFIQRCLEPLPISKVIVSESKKEKMEDKLTRNEEGQLNTEAVDRKTSLRRKALES